MLEDEVYLEVFLTSRCYPRVQAYPFTGVFGWGSIFYWIGLAGQAGYVSEQAGLAG